MAGQEDIMSALADGGNPDDTLSAIDSLGAIRCKYPGLCSINFEFLLELVLDKLVGNNPKKEGIFGKMDAYGAAVEEQGRKTLHGHILVFTSEWNELLRNMLSKREKTRRAAETEVCKLVDSIMTTQMAPVASDGGNPQVMACPSCNARRMSFATNQELRILRHKKACVDGSTPFARCDACQLFYSGDTLALRRAAERPIWDIAEHKQRAMMKRDVIMATLSDPLIPYDESIIAKINCLFNHHFSGHTRTCFKKGNECRAFLPDKEEMTTTVLRSSDTVKGFTWWGDEMELHTLTVRPRRLKQDAYTNCHSLHISRSPAPSNSNISITTGARSCIYATCYTFKPTQKEDTQEVTKMLSYIGHRFLEERRDSSLFEGISRLMGAAIVATSEHVVAAPMASYLVRNGSRFKCSHEFKYVPVREIVHFLNAGADGLSSSLMPHFEGCFLSNDALHYLKRPVHLEDKCLFDFCEQFDKKRCSKNYEEIPEEGEFAIDDEENPGYGKQKLIQRGARCLAQFSHWLLPDSASFGGNIWELEYPVNATVERYCQGVLVLFQPHRTVEDLTIDGSYFKKFRRTYQNAKPPPQIRTILSNVQMFYNSMRMPPRDDPINACTVPYTEEGAEEQRNEEDEEDSEFFDGMLEMLANDETHAQQKQPQDSTVSYDLTNIRKDGARHCGFLDLPDRVKMSDNASNDDSAFMQACTNSGGPSKGSNSKVKEHTTRDRVDPAHLMQLMYRNQRRRIDEAIAPTGQRHRISDGTALSIVEWSRDATLNLDAEQQTAFQIATAAFILTYYDDASEMCLMTGRDNARMTPTMRHDFSVQRRKLQALTRLRLQEPLVMYLDGAGGSGKSRVISELLLYARQFTEHIGARFDMRTIVVTAMSGVAAVSIRGETTHSAAFLNGRIPEDDVSWANARLLIIDEISFMNTHDLEKLDEKLRLLMKNHRSLYGGINIIFAGDFRQLEPCTGRALYSGYHGDKKWAHSINSYVELQGSWRFKDDPEWGRILSRIRRNTHTNRDIDAINECTIENKRRRGYTLPNDPSYCVFRNNDRSAINAGLFSKALEEATRTNDTSNFVVVRASGMRRKEKSGKVTPLRDGDKKFLYENCSDTRVTNKSGMGKGHFVAPLLKLHKHQPLMLVSNDDVPNGHANGTRVILRSVVVKAADDVKRVAINQTGQECSLVEAEDVEHLECHMEGNPTKVFKVYPKKMTCCVRAPLPSSIGVANSNTLNLTVELVQLPILPNYATTGHKLQGQTKKSLVISVWSKRRNWNYVALSRVTTRDGLYLARKLPYDVDFSIPAELSQMMKTLRKKAPGPELPFDIEEERTARRYQT